MLFEDRQEDQNADDIAALPKEIEAKPIELPKSASDVAPSEGGQSASTGYRIIPLTDGDSATSENEQTPSADSTEHSGTQAGSAENGDPIAVDDDVSTNAGYEQIRSAVGSGGSNSHPVATTEESAKNETVSKSKLTTDRKSKPGSSALTANSGENGAVESVSSDQPVAPPSKMKAKATPAKPTEKGSKKSGATKSVESVKPAPATAQKSAQIKPSLDNSRLIQPESVSKAPETASKPAVGGGGTKLSEPPIPAPEASDDLAAWVVQTGSFTAEGNARSLAEKLRKSNFPAFVEVVTNAGTSVYRVQVGPELNRTRAEQIQKQIENTVGIKGIVVPHP
jgi:DedD protein